MARMVRATTFWWEDSDERVDWHGQTVCDFETGGDGGLPKGQSPTNHLYRNNGDGTFRDVTEKAGLARIGWGQAVCIGDFDNDGNDDIFISYFGKNAFYRGAIAQRILATSSSHGGTMAAADLAEYESEWVDPISTTYRGWTVYELPPNGLRISRRKRAASESTKIATISRAKRSDCMRVLLECTCSQGSGALNGGRGACYPARDARRERLRGRAFGRVDAAHRAAKPGVLFDSPSDLRI